MKRIRLDRWAYHIQPPRNPRIDHPSVLHPQETCPLNTAQRRQYHVQNIHQWQHQHHNQHQRRHLTHRRRASSAATARAQRGEGEGGEAVEWISETTRDDRRPPRSRPALNAPSPRQALHSAKLSALHARLSLPSQLPLQTLARCLIDPSVDPRPGYNNRPFAILGQDLLGYYTAEWLLCRYPRLPMPVLFAAQYAYVGSQTLSAMRAEWGVEVVAAPGQEVDPGLLQLKHVIPGDAMDEQENKLVRDLPQARRLGSRGRQPEDLRRGMSSRIVHDDQFGDVQPDESSVDERPYPGAPISSNGDDGAPARLSPSSSLRTPADTSPTTLESASASFIRALAGALYLHAGLPATKAFHADHVLSRHLALHTLFHFTHPTRDLSTLCKREAFEPPVARLLSETGRLSRTPVFVVGVYSGEDKLGEAAGSSLNEARVRAAAAALRAWYLYSPPEAEIVLPSEVEGKDGAKKWRPQMVDPGEIVT